MPRVLLGLPGLLLAAAAWAQTPPAGSPDKPAPSRVEQAFDRADADKDGKLSRQEAGVMPVIEANFEAIDADRDGFLSRTEFLEKVTASQ